MSSQSTIDQIATTYRAITASTLDNEATDATGELEGIQGDVGAITRRVPKSTEHKGTKRRSETEESCYCCSYGEARWCQELGWVHLFSDALWFLLLRRNLRLSVPAPETQA